MIQNSPIKAIYKNFRLSQINIVNRLLEDGNNPNLWLKNFDIQGK